MSMYIYVLLSFAHCVDVRGVLMLFFLLLSRGVAHFPNLDASLYSDIGKLVTASFPLVRTDATSYFRAAASSSLKIPSTLYAYIYIYMNRTVSSEMADERSDFAYTETQYDTVSSHVSTGGVCAYVDRVRNHDHGVFIHVREICVVSLRTCICAQRGSRSRTPMILSYASEPP